MFGEIIGKVVAAASPVNVEVALFDSVLDPIESHVDGFGSSLFDGAIGNARGAGVVSLQGSGALWVAHVDESSAQSFGVFSIEEEGAELGFSGRRKDDFHDRRENMDGAIEWWRFCVGIRLGIWIGGFGAEEVVATSARASIGFGEIGSVAVDMEVHSTGSVANGSIRVSGTVVQ
jgi:hypothetical protein